MKIFKVRDQYTWFKFDAITKKYNVILLAYLFLYLKKVDILIPDFRYLLCFVKNWFSIAIFSWTSVRHSTKKQGKVYVLIYGPRLRIPWIFQVASDPDWWNVGPVLICAKEVHFDYRWIIYGIDIRCMYVHHKCFLIALAHQVLQKEILLLLLRINDYTFIQSYFSYFAWKVT